MPMTNHHRYQLAIITVALFSFIFCSLALADNASVRMEIIDEAEDKLADINTLLRSFDQDKDASLINKIDDKLEEIEGLIDAIQPIYEKDKNAKALIEEYPKKITDFRLALNYLKLAREKQFEIDPLVKICEDEEDDLSNAINKLLKKQDASLSDEIEDLAEDTEKKISKLTTNASKLVVLVGKLVRQAKVFSYRRNNWSNVTTALQTSADKIRTYQESSLNKLERGCEDLLLGDAQDQVKDALQQLADLDQVAEQRNEDFTDLRKRIDTYLKEVNKIKRADETMLDQLITAICGADIERNGDQADKLAKSITAKAQRKLKPSIDYIVLRQRDYSNELKPFLRNGSAQQSQAKRYMGLLHNNKKVIDKLKKSVVEGGNNPKIRAASIHGQKQHERMGKDSKYKCDAVEVVAGRGRADCVSIDKSKGCIVWEFKPSSYSKSKAMSQAKSYIPYINKKYKTNPKAAHCFPKGFSADVADYKACGN
jgi:hypothetical protein